MPKNTTSQTELDDCVKKWKSMDRSDAIAYYNEEIFPRVKDKFAEENCPDKKYEGLILTVGFSVQPLILSICAVKPQRIGLLYTPETEQLCDQILKETNYSSSNADCHKIDGSNPNGIYKTIWELRFSGNWKNFKEIAVDITGGKNAMAAGAGLAASVIPADIYYVDSDNYLPDFRMPEPGTEYLKRLESPFESTAYETWGASLQH